MAPLAQLPLNMQLPDDATFASFYPGENAAALKAVEALSKLNNVQGSENYVYLWGTEAGKTHLLQAACQAVNEKGNSAAYIPLADHHTLSPNMLQGIEALPLICIDDIDKIAGLSEWEENVFHLFNRIREVQGRLLIAGNAAPLHLNIQLPDLKSRLSWGVVYQLHRLSDEQKVSALQHRAQARGLELNQSVGQFLLHRSPRDLKELFASLEILDRASLASQRRLTIPFVKEVLKL